MRVPFLRLGDEPPTSRPAVRRVQGQYASTADTPISFDDIRRLPEAEWATASPQAAFWPGRYTVAALVPAGQLVVVPLPDPAETVIADVRAVLAELAPFATKAVAL